MWLRNALWVEIGFRDIFRHVPLLSLWSSPPWDLPLYKICKLETSVREIMIYWTMNDQNNDSSSPKILGNFSSKYWKRRSFVMIVNWGMLTKKTDEIGAAMWAQRTPNNKMLFIYEIVFVLVHHTSYGYRCDKGYNNAVWDRWDENLWMNILESHLGSCLPLPVSGSVSEPWKSPNGSVVVLL